MLVRCRLCYRMFALSSIHEPVPAHGHPDDEAHFCRGSGFVGVCSAPAASFQVVSSGAPLRAA